MKQARAVSFAPSVFCASILKNTMVLTEQIFMKMSKSGSNIIPKMYHLALGEGIYVQLKHCERGIRLTWIFANKESAYFLL